MYLLLTIFFFYFKIFLIRFLEDCLYGKHHSVKFPSSTTERYNELELIYFDKWGAPIVSLGGSSYFVSFFDDLFRNFRV